jgi:histidinol-phosphatase (PHP family)
MTFIKDSHMHTNYSPDADPTATFQDYVDEARRKGIKHLVFTDHVDLDAGHPTFQIPPIDYEAYIDAFNKVRDNTKDITMTLGVEMGYQTHMKKEINAFLARYPFEFVILSIHYVNKQDLYTHEFYDDKTIKEAHTMYFEACLDAIESVDTFNVFGHLDYFTRYIDEKTYDMSDYQPLIDKILKALIKKNKGIEINTSGFRYEDRIYPKLDLVNRFIELGGTIITIGSDAHTKKDLASNFNKVYNLLSQNIVDIINNS